MSFTNEFRALSLFHNAVMLLFDTNAARCETSVMMRCCAVLPQSKNAATPNFGALARDGIMF
jgi:hypothetical protein